MVDCPICIAAVCREISRCIVSSDAGALRLDHALARTPSASGAHFALQSGPGTDEEAMAIMGRSPVPDAGGYVSSVACMLVAKMPKHRLQREE